MHRRELSTIPTISKPHKLFIQCLEKDQLEVTLYSQVTATCNSLFLSSFHIILASRYSRQKKIKLTRKFHFKVHRLVYSDIVMRACLFTTTANGEIELHVYCKGQTSDSS